VRFAESLFSRKGLLFAWVALVVIQLPIREVTPPDEPRFANQAQSMRSTGEWVVPYISVDINVDKPPMLFWGAAIASLPFDRVTPTASRVPSAIASLIVLLLTVRLGRRLWGSDTIAYGGALVALTGIEFFQKAQWCSCDMTMAAFSFMAITLWGEASFDEPPIGGRGLSIALGWAAIGFGILSKGPVALFWTLFFVLAEAISRKRFRPLLRIVWNPGIGLMLIIVGAWLFALGQRAGWDFVYEVTIHQTVHRYVKAWNSVEPWWFYSYQMPSDLLPWTAFLPAAIAMVFRKRAAPDERDTIAARSLALFTLFGVAFFSGSSGKRGVYVMESFPAVSLLIAAAVIRVGLGGLGFLLMAAIGIAAGVLAPVAIASGAVRVSPALIDAAGISGAVALVIAGLAVASGAALGYSFLKRGRRELALASAVSGAIVFMFLAGTLGGAVWSRMQSAKPFCERIAAAVPRDALVAAEGTKFEQIMFYTLRPTIFVDSDEQCLDLLKTGRCRYAVITRERYERVRRVSPVDGLPILAGGTINGGEFVLLGPREH
jgi:4-amino-4-deoxy-L-arabinose transferase-like glycosyltransferase